MTAAKCFCNIIARSGTAARDRTKQVMPVCSGISGLGKTRILEEGWTILQKMETLGVKLDPKRVVRVIVPYFNGFSPQRVEQAMPIEASFSWRLLYRCFLDRNCTRGFDEWFRDRLPRNGCQLTLRDAANVIERKLRGNQADTEPRSLYYLFLGIDEYQNIDKVNAPRKQFNTSLLRELVETIGAFLCLKSSNLILLPMFAGTDLGVIASGSIANSSYYVTKRLPMTLLTVDQVFSIAESDPNYARLLKSAQICRNLFFLGGVPRWAVDYLTAVKETCRQEEPPSLDNIKSCFVDIWTTYVETCLSTLEIPQLVRLAAFAVSGRLVDPNGMFDGDWKWSRLRDSSLCLLIPCKSSTSGACSIHVPYALLHNIGGRLDEMTTDAEEAFASALNDLNERVDSTMFDLQRWQSWEMFGACFYAVRINAFLVLGHSTVTVGDLLAGTRMSDETCKILVKLVPSKAVQCAETFDSVTCESISQRLNETEKIDWMSSGCIAVNGDGGAGVDIFFSLKDATTDDDVVFVDQRKRQFGKIQPSHAKKYLGKLSVCPKFIKTRGARLVRGVMNCVSASNFVAYDVPPDCFLLSRDETEQFHGTLAYHPACTPVISINSACKTALKTVLDGTEKAVEKAVEEILKKRSEPSGGFNNSKELRTFFNKKRVNARFNDQYAEFSS